MQHTTTLLGGAVAPSPTVPRCRPSHQPSLRRGAAVSTPNLTTMEESHSSPNGRRPAPRSAGASNRPTKNENVLELVRFFQTQETPSRYDGGSALDILKAGSRRLLQLASSKSDRRLKREGAATPTLSEEKTDQTYRLAALQRTGFLPNASVDRVDGLDITRSQSKRDVEAIGRPWLEDSGKNEKIRENNRERMSLDLGSIANLASLVELSLAFPEVEDLSRPPPYQSRQNDRKHETAETLTGPSDSERRETERRRVNSVAATRHHGAPSAHKTAVKLGHDSGYGVEGHDAGEKSLVKDGNHQHLLQKLDKDAQTTVRPKSNSSLNVRASRSQLPDYLPPRVSSRNATSSSDIVSSGAIQSRRQLGHFLSIFPSPARANSSVNEAEVHGNSASDTTVRNDDISIDSFPLPYGSTLPSAMQSMMSGASSVSHDPFVSSPLRASFQGPIDALPLPAPTKPLPSLPEPVATQQKSTVSKRRFRPSGSSYPDVPLDQGHDRDGPSARHRRVLVPQSPRAARVRSYTAENTSTTGEGNSPRGDLKMGSLEHIRRREERVRALRMRDISLTRSHSSGENKSEHGEQKHYEESPVLGHSAFPSRIEAVPSKKGTTSKQDIPSKEDTSSKKDTSSKEDIPSKQDTNLKPDADKQRLLCKSPIPENPNPPPTVPLPADPPVSLHSRSSSQRRTGSTISLPLSTGSNGETSIAPSSPRRNHTFQANSVERRSRDQIINEDYHQSRRRSESPSLPSSDDEGHKTRVHPGRSPEQRSSNRELKSIPRPQNIIVTDQSDSSSYGRKSSTDHVNPPTPRFRGSYSQDQSSPRSQYSQRTTNSQESRASLSHGAPHLLEARIATLERQNKMLQAALLAALDTGVTFDADCVRSGLPTPLFNPGAATPPFMGTGFSPTPGLGGLGLDDMQHHPHHHAQPRTVRKQDLDSRPDSWASSRDRDRRSSFDTAISDDDGSDSIKELEMMLGEFDMAGPCDRSSAAQKAQ